jgi:serine/threonine-protein kinase
MNDRSARGGQLILESGVIVAKRYRLERLLAEGGMGTVWVARHVTLGFELALKFINAGTAAYADAIERFSDEARAAALLGAETDHVVRIFDFGCDEGVPFLAMELLRGEDLGARLLRRDRLTPPEIARLAAQIARALGKAHARGIVHRDLKPENIFVVHKDGEERVKILDFGIAKLLGPGGDSQPATPMGTLHYMAPELLTSGRIDCRADLWSFAVVLYRALTGVLPFDADSVPGLVRRICEDAPAPPSGLAPGLTPELDAFFARALRLDPAARFGGAEELARAFADAARTSWHPPPSARLPLELEPTQPAGPGLDLDDLIPTRRSPLAAAV